MPNHGGDQEFRIGCDRMGPILLASLVAAGFGMLCYGAVWPNSGASAEARLGLGVIAVHVLLACTVLFINLFVHWKNKPKIVLKPASVILPVPDAGFVTFSSHEEIPFTEISHVGYVSGRGGPCVRIEFSNG